MTLAIFDLDNTLINGDSDVLWGEFLGQHGHVDSGSHQREQQRYYHAYLAGELDILEFLRFQLAILTNRDEQTLLSWRRSYVAEKIRPIILPKALQLLRHHRDLGHRLLIITATNRFLTEPIAELLGVDHLIATEPEVVNGRYSGKVQGIPSFAQGKVARLRDWLSTYDENLDNSWFYTDSHNDLPLLELVTYPFAVDPDPTLADEAHKRNWPIISLR